MKMNKDEMIETLLDPLTSDEEKKEIVDKLRPEASERLVGYLDEMSAGLSYYNDGKLSFLVDMMGIILIAEVERKKGRIDEAVNAIFPIARDITEEVSPGEYTDGMAQKVEEFGITLPDESEEDEYADLGGKEITFISRSGRHTQGIVAFVDPDVGITIKSKDYPDEELACINGPSSPNKNDYLEGIYERFFPHLADAIKTGVVSVNKLEYRWEEAGGPLCGSGQACASGL